MWPFKRKKVQDSLSIEGLFPTLRLRARKAITLGFGIGEAIIGAITGFLAPLTSTFAGYAALSWAVAAVVKGAIAIGVSVGLSALSQALAKKPSTGSIQNNGRVFNTKSVTAAIKVCYGQVKIGGNWVFANTSGYSNKVFNVIMSWCEGEIEGVAKGVSEKAEFYGGVYGDGKNDLLISGIYTGTSAKYKVLIDGVNPDTFTWSHDYGATWEAAAQAISGLWQTLDDGVKIKFQNTTGHITNNFWYFTAGDAYWFNDKLMSFYESYNYSPLTTFMNQCLAWQALHLGTDTQTIDADLVSDQPGWADPMRNTAYSKFKLQWNDYAWQGLPEFRITVKGLKVHDTRATLFPNDTPAYSRNPALAWYDLMTSKRYGLGIDSARIDTASVTEVANWCDTNTYYLDMSLDDSMPFTEHIEDMLLNFRGFVTRSNGIYKLRVYSDDAAVMSLTDDDFDIEAGVTINVPGIPELPNRVKCSFIDAAKNYKTDFATYEEDAVLAVDDIERVMDIVLVGTSAYSQAKKLAKYFYLRARHGTTYTMVGFPRCFNLEPGDMVNVANDFLGWTGRKVRVASIGLPQEGTVPITFVEESSDIYDQTVDIETDDIWVSPAGDITADAPTNLTVVETGYDEKTWNKSDAYVIVQWDNPRDGTDFVLAYKKTVDTYWTEATVRDSGATPITFRIGGLPNSETYDWRVRQKRARSLSEWVNGADFTTYEPAGPSMADVVLYVSSEGNATILTWTKTESDFNIFEWIIYRNTTNNSGTATVIDYKSRATRTYRDLTVNTGTTYYYWLKATDRFDVVSTDFSTVGSEEFLHRITSPIYDTVGSGDIPQEEGATAFIADTILLDNCDDYTDFQDDAADANDIIIAQETINIKEGTGALKISAGPYRTKLSFEESYGNPYPMGYANVWASYRYISMGFKPTANYSCTAVALKIVKVGTPANPLAVDIYSDVGGVPDVSIASTTIAVANIPSALGEDPFTYAIFAAEALTSGTLYHIVLDAGAYSAANYYQVYGYFKQWSAVDKFGVAGEGFHISSNKTTWSHYGFDPSGCFDMNFRIAETSTALNKYVWSTIAAQDISTKTYLKFWIKSNRTGTNFQIGYGEAAISEQLTNVVIIAANTWEFKAIDISAIAAGDRNAVTKVGIKLTNLDVNTIVYLDYVFCNIGDPVPKIYIGGSWESYILENDVRLGKHIVEATDANIVAQALSEVAIVGETDYTMHKEIRIGCAGTYRIKFAMKVGTSVTVYGRIYKNGAPYGTEQTRTVNTYAVFSEDLDFVAGDLIQGYFKVSSFTSYEKDFIIYGDLGTPSVNLDN